MRLIIPYQESFSRAELLLRSFFGWLYIMIPHGIILAILGIISYFITFIAFFAILFTGKYPEGMFNFQVGVQRWQMRVTARMMNIQDGYPPFSMDSGGDTVDLHVPYPPSLSRGLLLLKVFFGFLYVGIPHGIILALRYIVVYIILFLAWWVVLFTGNYPESWHGFVVDTLRWQTRVMLYLNFMTDEYPPFTGK